MELLTTHQVQQILKVDRSTIYRMIERGRLQALRVGKQWRFSADAIARLLANPPQAVTHSVAGLLPVFYAQGVQDALASLLGVMMVTTDMQGCPITRVSNLCGFAQVLLQQPDGFSRCMNGWRQLADLTPLEPTWQPSEMGLLCARGLVHHSGYLVGMVVVGGVPPSHWPPDDAKLMTIARTFNVPFGQLKASVSEVCWLSAEARALALRAVQQVADLFSLWIKERQHAQT